MERVIFTCVACLMTVKPPVTKDNSFTWVEGSTRYYAHSQCEGAVRELRGLDNGGKVVTAATATIGHSAE